MSEETVRDNPRGPSPEPERGYRFYVEFKQSSSKMGKGYVVRAQGDDLDQVQNHAAALHQMAVERTEGHVCCHTADQCAEVVKEGSRE